MKKDRTEFIMFFSFFVLFFVFVKNDGKIETIELEKFVFVIAKFTIAERTAGGEGSSEVGEKRKICLFPLLGGKKTKRSSSRENENEKCENIMGKSVEAKKEKNLRQLYSL